VQSVHAQSHCTCIFKQILPLCSVNWYHSSGNYQKNNKCSHFKLDNATAHGAYFLMVTKRHIQQMSWLAECSPLRSPYLNPWDYYLRRQWQAALCEQSTLFVTPGRPYSKRNCQYLTQQLCCVSINISEGEACLTSWRLGFWDFHGTATGGENKRKKEREKNSTLNSWWLHTSCCRHSSNVQGQDNMISLLVLAQIYK
jgi:hypothetical protein